VKLFACFGVLCRGKTLIIAAAEMLPGVLRFQLRIFRKIKLFGVFEQKPSMPTQQELHFLRIRKHS